MNTTTYKPNGPYWDGPRPALLVIDMQKGFLDPAWGTRCNPALEANVALLLSAWRRAEATIVHIHHDSPSSDGHFRRDGPGHAPMASALPTTNESVIVKRVNSGFIGTSLEGELRKRNIDKLVAVGLTTNHCVSTTVRMASNLGFGTFVISDATAAFEKPGIDGRVRSAEEVHYAALSDLNQEFATVIDTAQAIAAVRSHRKGV